MYLKTTKAAIFLIASVFLFPGYLSAQKSVQNVTAMRGANVDIDQLGQEISRLSAHPGFRGFLRSELVKSRNRENIIELSKFFDRAMKQQGMPPELAKVHKMSIDAKGRLKSSMLYGEAARYDLYIPVEAHRKKWRGGKDFVVGLSPVNDEKEIRQITAYSVEDGRRINLDPNKAPEVVVLMLAPCEHESHERIVPAQPDTKEPLPAPVPQQEIIRLMNRDAGDEPYHPGNSVFQLKYTWIYDDHEPWYKGDPEIYVVYNQGKSGKPDAVRVELAGVNKVNRYYWTGSTNQLYFYYDDVAFTDQSYVAVWESDGIGGFVFGPEAAMLDVWHAFSTYIERSCYVEGIPCVYRVWGGDDYLGGYRFNKSRYRYGDYGEIVPARDAFFKVRKFH